MMTHETARAIQSVGDQYDDYRSEVTVGDKTVVGKLKTVPVSRKLPVVLSREHATPPELCCGGRLPRISERQLSGKIQFTR